MGENLDNYQIILNTPEIDLKTALLRDSRSHTEEDSYSWDFQYYGEESGASGPLVSFLTLGEKHSVFHHWVGCYLWVFKIFMYGLYYVEICPLIPTLFRVFIVKSDVQFFQMVFLNTKMILWFLSFALLMCCIMLTENTEPFLHPQNKSLTLI